MKTKILNAKFLTGNASILIPLKEAENRFCNILCGLRHRTEPIINIWGKNIGLPLIYFVEYINLYYSGVQCVLDFDLDLWSKYECFLTTGCQDIDF